MTGITSVGDGFFHGVTKEVLARKLTFEEGPEGEGYAGTDAMGRRGPGRRESRCSRVPGAGGAAGAGAARAVSKGTAEVSGR